MCARDSSPTTTPIGEGYRLALQKAGLSRDAGRIRTISPHPNDPEALRMQIGGILDWFADEGVTAAIIHNDEDALMFADSCMARGIRIPGTLRWWRTTTRSRPWGPCPLAPWHRLSSTSGTRR
ncbi:hypothetical protein PJ267_13895 [Arthrobacter sp. OVS8]|nr:hypothetical protein PJ267_13895 [Arthrobacter sp. OVS8]